MVWRWPAETLKHQAPWVLVLLCLPGAPKNAAENRYYVGKSPAACETIDYACPAGWIGFHDDKGCGCVKRPPDKKMK